MLLIVLLIVIIFFLISYIHDPAFKRQIDISAQNENEFPIKEFTISYDSAEKLFGISAWNEKGTFIFPVTFKTEKAAQKQADKLNEMLKRGLIVNRIDAKRFLKIE